VVTVTAPVTVRVSPDAVRMPSRDAEAHVCRYAAIYMASSMTSWSSFAWAATFQIRTICSWVRRTFLDLHGRMHKGTLVVLTFIPQATLSTAASIPSSPSSSCCASRSATPIE
jgi:hypothetical protein